MKIIFFGTPDFAVATLKALVSAGFDVCAVVTVPDKPAGRGMKLQMSPVKAFSVENNIPLLQPEKLKDEVFISQLKSYQADLQIVVAFRMLPEVVWNMPPFGTVNLHASLLPQYRGAAPINWAIINGEKITGITTFKLQHEIDTGNILLQKEVVIANEDNAGTLHDKLMKAGADLMVQTVYGLQSNTIVEQPQILTGEVKLAPKIFTETCKLNWEMNAEEINNFIRGLSPFPTAYTSLNEKKLKVFGALPEVIHHKEVPGNISTDNKTYIKYACKDGYIYLKEIQLEGKKRMSVEDFLRGNKL